MFKMGMDNKKKVFTVKVGGFIREDEAEQFLKEYNGNIKGLGASDITLILDGEDLLCSKASMLGVLEGCFQLYRSSGFKRIVVVNPKQIGSKLQLKRTVDKIVDVEYVDNINEIRF